ncbi:hypothetical protein CSUI_006546 [Cystoisospora suis]|uniref:Uncharacterized protein n=1 Tax=Cystoisospora suis TaxID=483139 RepID=A0A2C6KQ01_9APIC|nr:hypothetical protein CSUI_006546 [Cystoisospora suis]
MVGPVKRMKELQWDQIMNVPDGESTRKSQHRTFGMFVLYMLYLRVKLSQKRRKRREGCSVVGNPL